MGFEIQIHNQILIELVHTTLRETLSKRCIPAFPPYYVDHIDVGMVTMKMRETSAIFSIVTDVFIVDERSLQDNVNRTPPEAVNPAGQALIIVELTIQGDRLHFTGVDIIPGEGQSASSLLALAIIQLKAQILHEVGTLELSLDSIISQIGLDSPQISRIEPLVSGLAVRFDPPATASVDILDQRSRTWCLVMEEQTVMHLTVQKLTGLYDSLRARGIPWSIRRQGYSRRGDTPHIDFIIPIWMPVALGYGIPAEIVLGLDFGMETTPFQPRQITETVDWHLRNIDLNQLPISVVPPEAQTFIPYMLSGLFDPSSIRGTPIDRDTFILKQPFPPMHFGSASFLPSSLTARAEGMVISGNATFPTTTLPPTYFNVEQFPDRFIKWLWCGKPSDPSRTGVGMVAKCSISAGVLCDAEIIAPLAAKSDLELHKSADEFGVTVNLPVGLADSLHAIGESVKLRIRCSRGVRIIDFGLPPASVKDGNGEVTNIKLVLMSDCANAVPVGLDPWIMRFHRFNPQWHIDPPPSWVDRIEQVGAFVSSIVTIRGTPKGEIAIWDQPLDGGMSIIGTADEERIVIPTLLAVRSLDEGARLETLGRSALKAASSESKLFTRVASIRKPGVQYHQLQTDGRSAKVISTFKDYIEITQIEPNGTVRSFTSGKDGESHAKLCRCASKVDHDCEKNTTQISGGNVAKTEKIEVAGVELGNICNIHSVPGFENSSVSVAELDDGTYRCILRTSSGTNHVTGKIARWLRLGRTEGDWAISSTTAEEIAVFAVERIEVDEENCCEDCQKKYRDKVFKEIMADKVPNFVPVVKQEASQVGS